LKIGRLDQDKKLIPVLLQGVEERFREFASIAILKRRRGRKR
jgi:hypothetical protein